MEDPKSTGSKSASSRAELAREKRMKSIEEEAKKQAEKEAKKANEKKGKRWIKIGTTILVIALALLIFFFSFFGVFDRQGHAIKYKDGSHAKVTGADNYFGPGSGKSMTGFDYEKKPSEQKFKSPQGQNETVPKKYGANPTWADYFEYKAIEDSESSAKVYKIAEKKGYKLTKSEQKQLDDFIAELKDSAKQNEYSLDAFLRSNYGRGMTEKLLRKIYTKQTITQRYLNDQKAKFESKVTPSEMKKEFKNNSKDYTTISVRYYQISDTIAASKAEKMSKSQKNKINAKNKKKAAAFVAKATDANFSELASQYATGTEKSSVKSDASYTTLGDTTYSSLSSYITPKAADWAFAKSTKVGDKKVFAKTDSNGLTSYAVVLLSQGQTTDNSYPVAVRQILVKSGTDSSTGETVRSDKAAKALADKILQKYQSGKHTEAAFSALAKKYTEDDGSKENGGLYEDVTPDSQYVTSFKNWALGGHAVGDVAIIKTEYGYHIMYYVGKSQYPKYMEDVKDAVANKKYDAWYNKIVNKDKAKVSKSWLKKVRRRVDKSAETLIANLNSQQQQSVQSYGAY